jgi:hypothetical protein
MNEVWHARSGIVARRALSMPARRTVNKTRERARHQLVNWRRSGAQASRAVRVCEGGLDCGEHGGGWASPGPKRLDETKT